MSPDVRVTVLCRSCVSRFASDGAFNLTIDDALLGTLSDCPRCGAKDVAVVAVPLDALDGA